MVPPKLRRTAPPLDPALTRRIRPGLTGSSGVAQTCAGESLPAVGFLSVIGNPRSWAPSAPYPLFGQPESPAGHTHLLYVLRHGLSRSIPALFALPRGKFPHCPDLSPPRLPSVPHIPRRAFSRSLSPRPFLRWVRQGFPALPPQAAAAAAAIKSHFSLYRNGFSFPFSEHCGVLSPTTSRVQSPHRPVRRSGRVPRRC